MKNMSQQLTIEQALSRAKKAAKQGKLADALELYGIILQHQPQHPVAIKGMRKLQKSLQRNQAIPARTKTPSQDQINALNNLYNSGQMTKTEQACRELLRTYPQSLTVLNVLGKTLRRQGKLQEAVQVCDKAIKVKPDRAKTYYNRGVVLQELGQLEDAIKSYDRAIQLEPDFSPAYSNRGGALKALGHLEEAVRNFDRLIQLEPDSASAHWNLSLTLLLQGNFKDGWREYEWRWRKKDFKSQRRSYMQPQWDGSSLDGKTILLDTEQGAGDSIQFIRYVKEVAKYNVKIIVECEESLVRLFSTLPEIDVLIGKGEKIPAFDVQAPLLSLPYIFETGINTIPADIPYLFEADDEGLSLPQLSPTKLNVGIVWAGSSTHQHDRERSTSLSGFLPLASVPDIQLFSLQTGDRRKDPGNIADDSSVIDLTEGIHDYADTARIIAHLDLVISVDTSVAHLAGAMGKPTWVVLPFSPDFRWLLDRDDSPWYPTVRLFRQKTRGNWSDVFSKVKTELNKYSRLHVRT
jgi:tetratricopeptide (TPR) repeat protein